MTASFIRKILILFMTVITFTNTVSINITDFISDNSDYEISYSFANNKDGSAEGTVSLHSAPDGTYELYWGDSEGEKLTREIDGYTVSYSEFAAVEVDDGEGSTDIYGYTFIPQGASTVIAYRGSLKCAVTDIPEEKLTEDETPLYTFGALSDVHYSRYYSMFADVAEITFPNALKFLDALDVSAVAISGDLSDSGEEEAFRSYFKAVSDYDFPVLTVTGNHDVSDDYTLDNWNKYINADVYSENEEGVLSVSGNRLDFSYSIPGTDDVFIFLNQTAWEYGDPVNDRILTDNQLDWLEEQLIKHRNTTVYLFFHTFTSDVDGNPSTACGNLINSKGVTYDLIFTPGAPDEVRFKELLTEYKNVIFFSGHSHWAFHMQKFNPELNITDYEGRAATSVHVSSVTCPRTVKENGKNVESNHMSRSEGYYIEVYEDEILLYGVDFLRGEFLSYAIYRIEL